MTDDRQRLVTIAKNIQRGTINVGLSHFNVYILPKEKVEGRH